MSCTTKTVPLLMAALLATTTAAPAAAQRASATPPPPPESVFIYYVDEIPRPGSGRELAGAASAAGVPTSLVQRRQSDPIFDRCRAAEAQTPAVLVPLILFGVKLFGSVVERHLAAEEAQRLASLSRTFAQVRADAEFPMSQTGPQFRCLVIDRGTIAGGEYTPGAVYVLGLRRVGGSSAFTIEPIAARMDVSAIAARARPERMNTSISLTLQSIVPNSAGNNEQFSSPVYSVSFEGLTLGQAKQPPSRRSPVMPIPRSQAVPTSIAVAVTESHSSLDRVKQQIALEQANRAALLTAIGEAVKAGITD
jgi:hypothetical protein